jgi:AhpD family alkylhydroperoxidase
VLSIEYNKLKSDNTMQTVTIPARETVSENNKALFDGLKKNLGFVPNLYAYFANSETALSDYLSLQNRKSTLRNKEREVINLVTSEINGCRYCQSAHTVIGKMNGFTEEQILELRSGSASFDAKLDVLAKFTAAVVQNRGRAPQEVKNNFFAAGYTEAHLVDAVIIIGDKIISNYIHNLTEFTIDFPVAVELNTAAV